MTTTYTIGHIKTVAIVTQDNRSCEQPCSCYVFLTFYKLKRKPEQNGTQISGTSQNTTRLTPVTTQILTTHSLYPVVVAPEEQLP